LQEGDFVSNNCKNVEVVKFIKATNFDYHFKLKAAPKFFEKKYEKRQLEDEPVLAEDYAEHV